MILRIIIALAVLLVVFTLIHKFQNNSAKGKKSADKKNSDNTNSNNKALMIKIVVGIVLVAILIGSATGKIHPIGALLAILVPFARFGMTTAKFWFMKTGGKATFKTQYLHIHVTVSTATYSGRVLKGPYADTSIENLSKEQLQELQDYYETRDKKSYYLIKAIRQSMGFASAEQNEAPPPPSTILQTQDALEILGLNGNPTRKEIIAAHRKLINKLHPDRGGSDFLAAQVNQARDTLLKQLDE